MSEFSEVYFLKSNDTVDVVRLLKKADVSGYIYPARDGWVAFVANTKPLFEFSEKLKVVNEGVLLQFVNAEDHGWGFEVCNNNGTICSYYCTINEEMYAGMDIDEIQNIDMESIGLEESFLFHREKDEGSFEKLLEEEKGDFEVLRKYFDQDIKIEEIVDAYDFAQSMKLYFSEWVSYHYAEQQNGEMDKYGEYDNLKLIKVN